MVHAARRWAMTERRRDALRRDATSLEIGPSAMKWDGRSLEIDINEISAPWPHRLRGHVRVEPETINPRAFTLESQGSHIWRPIAPIARVSAAFSQPESSGAGMAILTQTSATNRLKPVSDAGLGLVRERAAARRSFMTPSEGARGRWLWALSLTVPAVSRRSHRLQWSPCLAHVGASKGRHARKTAAPALSTDSRIRRSIHARMVEHALLGERVSSMHESLDLDRFANPLVRAMLPFRMPRI